MSSALKELIQAGVSAWLDDLSRSLIKTRGLVKLFLTSDGSEHVLTGTEYDVAAAIVPRTCGASYGSRGAAGVPK